MREKAVGRGKRSGPIVKDWVSIFADDAVVAIDAMAVLIIVAGTLEMFVTCVRSVFAPSPTGRD